MCVTFISGWRYGCRDAMHCVSAADDHRWGFDATGCDAMADDPENQKRGTAGYGHYQPSLSKTWNRIDDGRDARPCVSTARRPRWGSVATGCDAMADDPENQNR